MDDIIQQYKSQRTLAENKEVSNSNTDEFIQNIAQKFQKTKDLLTSLEIDKP